MWTSRLVAEEDGAFGDCKMPRCRQSSGKALEPDVQGPDPGFAIWLVVEHWGTVNLLMPQFHLLPNGDESWTFLIELV